jgi:hypothetical protein
MQTTGPGGEQGMPIIGLREKPYEDKRYSNQHPSFEHAEGDALS